MTKQIYGKVLTTALLLGTAATGAHAQTPFTTTGTYVPTGTDATARTVISATGNSEAFTVFQTNVAAAFAAGTGGDITFDNTTFAAAPSFNATYGVTQGSTLTVSDVLLPGATGTYGPGSEAPAANTTSGSNYIGFAGASNTNFNFTFSQKLSDFGIMVINRGAVRSVTFAVNLSNGTTVTPVTAFPTSGAANPANPVFFEYAPTGGLTITGVTLTAPEGLTRFDDLGFIVAPAVAAAPEPSQFAAFGIGLLGLGMLGLKARKRSILA